MGVSAVGKSVVAERLAPELDLELAEGDDFHPPANVAKMAAGESLTDADRAPWLAALARWTADRDRAGRGTAVTCSALRRAYRNVLAEPVAATFFVHLHGSEDLLRSRISGREHFMPAALLRSQLQTLEPLAPDEDGVVVDVAAPLDEVVATALHAVRSWSAG